MAAEEREKAGVCGHVPEILGDQFAILAGKVFLSPFKVIWASLFMVFFCATGVLMITIQRNTEILYSPADSQAHQDYDEVLKSFPNAAINDPFYVLQISHPERNLLQDEAALNQIAKFEEQVRKRKNFPTYCGRSPQTDACQSASILNNKTVEEFLLPAYAVCFPAYWDPVSARYYSTQQVAAELKPGARVPATPGQNCPDVLGPATIQTKANAILTRFDAGSIYDKICPVKDDEKRPCKAVFVDELDWMVEKPLEEIKAALGTGYVVSVYNAASRDIELSKSISGDIPLFAASLALLANFAIFSFMPTGMHVVAVMDVLGGFLAVICSIGVCCALGVEFNSTVAFFPFLLMGTSVDDTFIMLRSLQKIPVKGHSPQYRVVECLRHSAPSMFMTSTTDVLAFGVGAITATFPATVAFCLFCCVGNIFDFFLQMTWCVAWISIDTRRQALETAAASSIICAPRRVVADAENLPVPELDEVPDEFFQIAAGDIQQVYENSIASMTFRVCVMLVYAVLLVLSFMGAQDVKVGQDLKELAPSDSYIQAYYETKNKYFSIEGIEFDLMLTGKGDKKFKYWDVDDRATIKSALAGFLDKSKENEFDPDSLTLWYEEVDQNVLANNITCPTAPSSVRVCTDKTGWIAQLKTVLTSRSDIVQDLKWNKDETDLTHSLIHITTKRGTVDDPKWRIDAEGSIKNGQEKAEEKGVTIPVTLYGNKRKFLAADAEILGQTLTTLIAAVIGVLLIVLVFMPNALVAIVVSLALVSIDVFVLGGMALTDQSINTVSMMVLVLSVGFSVDCIAHVCLAYVVVPYSRAQTRLDRVTQAVRDVGSPVLQAGLSTLFGILPTYFSQSQIFQNFFVITFFVLAFGLMHGLFIVPIVLSWAGPMATKSEEVSQLKRRQSRASLRLDAVQTKA